MEEDVARPLMPSLYWGACHDRHLPGTAHFLGVERPNVVASVAMAFFDKTNPTRLVPMLRAI